MSRGLLQAKVYKVTGINPAFERPMTMTFSGFMTTLTRRSAAFAALALATLSVSASATAIPVVNGSFESTNVTQSSEFGGRYSVAQVTGWTTGGYNFVMLPGQADTIGANSEYGNLQLWGPGNGAANGLTASPDGGNYLAMDGAYAQAPISQEIYGLVAGQQYTVSFFFAGAQQHGYNGPTTEQFEVSLGNENQFTQILNNVEHGFTGWNSVSMTFTATSSHETLSFLAIGMPAGVPPFSLLDGVTVNGVTPEPGSLALLATGMFGIGGLVRSRFTKKS